MQHINSSYCGPSNQTFEAREVTPITQGPESGLMHCPEGLAALMIEMKFLHTVCQYPAGEDGLQLDIYVPPTR